MHVTAKPSSFQCNLKCDYCFYLEKESQFTHEKWMDDSTLKEFIKQYIAASGNQVYFTWQGGEPTLAGLDFFRKVIHYQQRYAGQKRIFNALQTNGILLNNEWCAFLKEHEFLVGISIDGPQELNRWFADKNYYFTQIYGEHKNTDNPDQRIAEDILLLISKTLSLSFGFIQSLSMLITFTVILWQSAGTLSFTVGGTEWNIQGYMVYTVVLIVIGGTLFTHKVGKRIRPLNVEKQRSEATFRTNLVQHNKQAELIALSNAESLQRQELSDNFHTIKENWHRLMNRQRWLDYWQNIYSRSLSVLPYFLLLPQFISGQINLGGLMKSRQAFMLVSNNLSWFIYKYDELAELAAVIDRLYEFHQLTEQRPTNKPKNCQHAVQVANASIRTPDNKIILENLNFHVSPGKWLLLKGYSGAGKTTLLKTLSHCWPWFKGDISSPADSWYVSQTPLIKSGLLKEIICKALPLPVDDKSLSEVLHQVGLGKLAARIHEHDRWGDILSSGEKQRIALARLILRRPKWIFLDETTSHLEEQEAIRLLRLVREKLPTSGVIMVTHQPGVWNLADDICDISTVL
ncbi:ATP-binding cassette domain-containing protein [Escherichia coli]|nr:ATP-binding cassette domain-containing protein [Escherichia coli]